MVSWLSCFTFTECKVRLSLSRFALFSDVLSEQSRMGYISSLCFCGHIKCLHLSQRTKSKKIVSLLLCWDDFPVALRAPLPPAVAVWKQDAESITAASSNQSAEVSNELRRIAATNTLKPRLLWAYRASLQCSFQQFPVVRLLCTAKGSIPSKTTA